MTESATPLGRYLLGPVLGTGGMGRVHEAWDPSLKRVVALKVLHEGTLEAMTRFVQEAQLQARVHHPCICPIYDVDLDGPEPLIAMRRIQGPSLVDARLEPREAVRVIAEAAGAVHAAHRAGLVHRDLKPGNLMLEPQPEGPDRVYVLDFGLARDLEGPTLTRGGVGTPGFMSPEQCFGHTARVGPATDVFGLGATLFFLLAGCPPVSLERILEGGRAPRLRALRPDLPEDLDLILSTCLDWDPACRYPSAFALEEDLRRWLASEPLGVAAPGPWRLLGQWARRNRALVTVLVTASLAVLGTSLMAARARQRQALAQRFAFEAEALHHLVRTALLNPPHDLRPMRRQVRQRMVLVSRQMDELGRLARGPGQQALGMGHLALGDLESARRWLQAAWDTGERNEGLTLALGSVLGERYRAELEVTRQTLGIRGREARRPDLRRRYLEPALNLMRPLSPEEEPARVYLQALLTFLQEDRKEAIRLARLCGTRDPRLHEARILEGRAWLDLAESESESGQVGEARKALEQAGEVLAKALDARRSDPDTWVLEARRRLQLAMLLEHQAPTSLTLARFREATEACRRAMDLDPDHVPARLEAARICCDHAVHLRDHGKDASAVLEVGMSMAREAVTLDPQRGAAHFWMGRLLQVQAVREDRQGRCEAATLEATLAAYQKAEALGWPSAHPTAQTYRLLAKTRIRFGQDPQEAYVQGLRWARKAVETQADLDAHYGLALLLLNFGHWEAMRGRDSRPALQEAEAISERGYAQYHDGFFLYSLVHARYQAAVFEWLQGRDPSPALDAALRSARQAVAEGPQHAIQHLSLGLVEAFAARIRLERGERPAPEAALRALDRAAALNPAHPETHLARARLLLPLAPALPWALEEARRALDRAAACGSGTPELYALRAQYHRRRGTPADLEAGRAGAEHALRLNPRIAWALAERGLMKIRQGRLRGDRYLDREGRDDLVRAVQMDATIARDYPQGR